MGLQIYTRFFCYYREDNIPQLQDVSLYLKRKYIGLCYYLQSADNCISVCGIIDSQQITTGNILSENKDVGYRVTC